MAIYFMQVDLWFQLPCLYRYQDRLRIWEAFGDGQSTFPQVVLETDHVQDSTGHAYMIHNLDQAGMWPVWNEFSMSMWFAHKETLSAYTF